MKRIRFSLYVCKRILIFIALSGFMANLPANALHIKTGIKGGMSLSGLMSKTGDFRHAFGYEMDWLSMGNSFGGQVGLFSTFDISKTFKFQPELFYVNWGGDGSETFVFEKILYKVTIQYIQVPLLLKVNFLSRKKIQPVLHLGPYLALKLNAKKNTEIWGEKEQADLVHVKSLDYGLAAGAGFELALKRGRIIFELRSNLGLKNIMTVPEGMIRLYDEKDSIRNFSFAFLTGVSF